MAVSRRALFKYSLAELLATVEDWGGRPSFKLSALADLGAEELGRLVPAITDASHVVVVDDVAVVDMKSGRREVLFRVGSLEADVWPRIDGRTSIQSIADSLALVWCDDIVSAFTRVRTVFLALASSGVCLPLNPLE